MKTTDFLAIAVAALLFLPGCRDDSEPEPPVLGVDTAQQRGVDLQGGWDPRLSPEELESGRQDPSWQRVVQLDTAGLTPGTVATPEEWEQISAQAVNDTPMQLPLYRESEGPSVLRAQVLLDRAHFSPGVIDGRWGKNTEKAVYWFQYREGLRRTGWVDQDTFDRLVSLAGMTAAPDPLVRTHTLTADDVEGPFVTIPEDIYEKAELECSCYESLSEKLAELFHTTPEILAQLNPALELDAVTAGTSIEVPAVGRAEAGSAGTASTPGGATAEVARVVVSAQGFYVHALDSAGRILYHFPSTLGSSFDPSPSGSHEVVSITHDPWWHYQPSILEHVDDSEEEAMIPAGPNNAVGLVWMELSIPHYGIHGTSAPETIGYTTSAGCVRLTNWDALFLADRVGPGTPVEFTEEGAPAAAGPR